MAGRQHQVWTGRCILKIITLTHVLCGFEGIVKRERRQDGARSETDGERLDCGLIPASQNFYFNCLATTQACLDSLQFSIRVFTGIISEFLNCKIVIRSNGNTLRQEMCFAVILIEIGSYIKIVCMQEV